MSTEETPYEEMAVEDLFTTVAIVLCNRATGANDDDELAGHVSGVTYYELFTRCLAWINTLAGTEPE